MDTKIAITKAQEKGLDLVEVSPIANPPVCKFTDFGQFQYSKSKKQKEQKKKKVEIKGIRLSLKIGKHDIDFRVKQAEKFLKQGDKVKIELNLKGREKAHKDLAKEVITNFIETIENEIVAEQELKAQGGRLSTIIKSK
jgi:translation initiation factor IF-3